MNKKTYILLGPTSSGKTTLAIDLCKKYEGEILSADSRQIYRGMDIGTGKVPVANQLNFKKNSNFWTINDIKVWGYDLVPPDEFFSSYDFAQYALNLLRNSKSPIFFVGGTGFYIDMVTGRIKPSNIKPDFKLREDLEKLSLEELQTRYDAASSKKIDRNNPVRLMRAIEKSENLSSISTNSPLPYLENTEFIHIGLTAPRNYLYEKVDKWADSVWENGLLEETSYFLTSNPRQLNGLVYKQAKAYLTKELSKEDAIQQTKYALHAYIRRQQTYFKKIPNVIWVDITEDNYKQNIYNIING